MVDRVVTMTLRRKRTIRECKDVTITVTEEDVKNAPFGNGNPNDLLDVLSAAEAAAEKADDGTGWKEESLEEMEALDPVHVDVTPPMK